MWFLIPLAAAVITPIAVAITCDAISDSHRRKRDRISRRHRDQGRAELQGLVDAFHSIERQRADDLSSFNTSHLSTRNRRRFHDLCANLGASPPPPKFPKLWL